MKLTKVRNRTDSRAFYQLLSKQLGTHLSKDLREKYGVRSIRISEGDAVKILRGEYKGIDGKITKVSIEKNGVAIEGIKKEKLKGEKIDVFIHTSNVLITDLNTDDKWRLRHHIEQKPKSISKTDTLKEKDVRVPTKKEQITKKKPKIKKVQEKPIQKSKTQKTKLQKSKNKSPKSIKSKKSE